MPQAQEEARVSRPEQRMVAAHRHLQGFAGPVAHMKARRHVEETPQHQVDLTIVQRVGGQGRGQVLDRQLDARRAFGQAPHQRRHADQLHIIGHGDAKTLMAARRIEGLAGDQAVFDLLQRMTDRSLQRQGSRRRLHGPADAHQQRVVEQLAQATRGIAHRRLAEDRRSARETLRSRSRASSTRSRFRSKL